MNFDGPKEVNDVGENENIRDYVFHKSWIKHITQIFGITFELFDD